jgi:hypothetical protein
MCSAGSLPSQTILHASTSSSGVRGILVVASLFTPSLCHFATLSPRLKGTQALRLRQGFHLHQGSGGQDGGQVRHSVTAIVHRLA